MYRPVVRPWWLDALVWRSSVWSWRSLWGAAPLTRPKDSVTDVDRVMRTAGSVNGSGNSGRPFLLKVQRQGANENVFSSTSTTWGTYRLTATRRPWTSRSWTKTAAKVGGMPMDSPKMAPPGESPPLRFLRGRDRVGPVRLGRRPGFKERTENAKLTRESRFVRHLDARNKRNDLFASLVIGRSWSIPNDRDGRSMVSASTKAIRRLPENLARAPGTRRLAAPVHRFARYDPAEGTLAPSRQWCKLFVCLLSGKDSSHHASRERREGIVGIAQRRSLHNLRTASGGPALRWSSCWW